MSATPIVALDVPTLAAALGLVRRLEQSCDFYKIGSELFTAEGPAAIRTLTAAGKRVFLDLKFHDIPNTVRAAARSAAAAGASLITVHAAGGSAMLEAAVEGAGPGCGVLAVTVLTSMDAEALATATGRASVDLSNEVLRLASFAYAAGAHGIVCSGQEVRRVRSAHPDGLAILVPGIRFEGDEANDQRRVSSPAAAAEAGATYLVLGRAVTAAPDPAVAMARVNAALLAAASP
jgi:orotidine-5'-phosphate decarboxylase